MKHNALPVISVALGNILWGLSFLFIQTALQYAASPVMLAHRFTIAVVILAVFALVTRKKITLKGKDWPSLAMLMAAQLAYYFFETQGLQYSNTTISGLVLAVVPIVAIVTGAVFLKEYPTKRQVILCLFPVAGVIVMTVSGKELGVMKPLGIVFLLCACFSSAMYKTANRKSARDFSPFERTFFVLLASAVTFTVAGLSMVSWDVGAFFQPLTNPMYTGSVLFLGVFCSITADILVNYAAGRMPVLKVTAFGALSTLCTMVTGVLILHEPMNLSLLLGAVLILFGIRKLTVGK